MLRAAVTRTFRDLEQDPAPVLKLIPSAWVPKMAVRTPNEVQAQAYEKEALKLPFGKRALALLPLAMGLRAEELLSLTRPSVAHAVQGGELMIMRKGGREQSLPCEHVVDLFSELLEVPAARGRSMADRDRPQDQLIAWGLVGEILSRKNFITRYHLLRDLIAATGRMADVVGMRPHLLRHVFASRMERDGASLSMIQAWLGHANVNTTLRYVHPETSAGKQFLRPIKIT